MKKVSVIVPVYKVEKYLHECVESILRQTYRELQIILVDDGSPDGSGAICDEYALCDDRITVIHGENGGLSAARNRGMALCEGEYVLFVDSDDWLEDNAIEVLVNKAKADLLDILLYDAISFDENTPEPSDDSEITKYIRKQFYPGVYTGADLFTQMLKNDEYRSPVQYYFYKRSFLDDHQLRFHEGILHEDEEFNFFALLYAQRVAHISDVLYHHRFRVDSIMGARFTQRNVDGCYQIIMTAMDQSDYFLSNPQTVGAYKTGLARLIRIFYDRVTLSVDSDSPKTQEQIKKLRLRLKQVHYYDDDNIKKAVLNKRKKNSIKRLKMRLYPHIAPILHRNRK